MTTFSSRDEAERVGEELVERRLAACGTVFPAVHSFFHWEGRVQREHESMLLLKTTRAASASLQAELQRLHPYENPEVLEIPVSGGAPAYLAWLGDMVDAGVRDESGE
jgi:periplasmic divalent cation tolerance protein